MARLSLLLLSQCDVGVAFPNGTGVTSVFAPFLLRETARIPETFLSFNFDWNLNQTTADAWTNASFGWSLDLQDERLIRLATALAPANLRVGGSPADFAEYDLSFTGGVLCSEFADSKHTCLSAARWDELIGFAEKAGLRLVFDLNIMFGRGSDGSGEWDPSNAFALLNYTASKYPSFRHGFELGNEKEFIISAESTARAFIQLRRMVNSLWPSPQVRPIVVGPSLNPRPDWLLDFLDNLEEDGGTIDVLTYHMYAGYGRSENLPSLILEPAWLDFTHQVMAAIQRSQLASPVGRQAELWIGETAAAWASGTAGVCDGFVSGFWWIDQLGMAATTGHGAMCRQCLVGGNYSLLDQLNGLKPNPDFWSAYVWRQLVGTQMLAITQVMPFMGDFKPKVRAYMACTKPSAPGYKEGSVTLIFINQDTVSHQNISMYQQDRFAMPLGDSPWGPTPPSFNNLPRLEYVLTAPEGDVLSRSIELNDEVLQLGVDGRLPQLKARVGDTREFVVPPKSYGMAVYPMAQAPACMHQKAKSSIV